MSQVLTYGGWVGYLYAVRNERGLWDVFYCNGQVTASDVSYDAAVGTLNHGWWG